MAGNTDTRILFVPYRPRGNLAAADGENGISQQKHAAREYHRKAKQRRQGERKKSVAFIVSKSEEEDDENDHTRAQMMAARSLFPRHKRALTPYSAPTITIPQMGSGRLDPFDSYPVKSLPPYVHEMLEYALVYQWTVYSFCNPDHSVTDMKRFVQSLLTFSSTVFYSIIYAAACHNALTYHDGQPPQDNLMLRLDYKKRFLEQIRHEIEMNSNQVSSQTLFAMLSLAVLGSSVVEAPLKHVPSKSVLATAHELEFYGRLRCEWAHFRALCHLVEQRGGLQAIPRRGFALCLSIVDVQTASQRLAEPAFSLLSSTDSLMASWPDEIDSPVSSTVAEIGSGFQELCDNEEAIQDLVPHITHISDITAGYIHYLSKDPNAPTLHQILSARHSIQHDLLRLPHRTAELLFPNDSLYEICRLTLLCFSILVLHPLPRGQGPHKELANQLSKCLDNCRVFGLWSTYPDLLLWATVLGGMIAQDGAARFQFLVHSQNSVIRQSIGAWPLVKKALSMFLWVESDCDAEGIKFWCEACELSGSELSD